MRIAVALSLALLSAACVARPAASERLSESQWRFVTIDGAAPAVPEKATLTFADDRISASVGCNGMGGEWRIEGQVTGVDRTIEVDLDANLAAPEIGRRLGLRINRAKLFQLTEATP